MDIFYEMQRGRAPITYKEMEEEKSRLKIGNLYTFFKNDTKDENTNLPRKVTGVIKGIYPNFFTVEYSLRGNLFTECVSYVDAVFYRRGQNPFGTQ